MGLLNLFSKAGVAQPKLDRPPIGSLAVDRSGSLVASSLPSSISRQTQEQIGRTALRAFASARTLNAPLSDLIAHFSGLKITVRELRGGALIFLEPEPPNTNYPSLPIMSTNTLGEFILFLEAYIECWKQFNHYINQARTKKYTGEDEVQFLEVKSLVTQGLETIVAAVEHGAPRKDEVMSLISNAPSIRYLVEHENSITTVESQWHKTFLTLHSLLGRLKVQQQRQEGEWSWSSIFGKSER